MSTAGEAKLIHLNALVLAPAERRGQIKLSKLTTNLASPMSATRAESQGALAATSLASNQQLPLDPRSEPSSRSDVELAPAMQMVALTFALASHF